MTFATHCTYSTSLHEFLETPSDILVACRARLFEILYFDLSTHVSRALLTCSTLAVSKRKFCNVSSHYQPDAFLVSSSQSVPYEPHSGRIQNASDTD